MTSKENQKFDIIIEIAILPGGNKIHKDKIQEEIFFIHFKKKQCFSQFSKPVYYI
jgi:hypothetical protein